MGAKRGALLVLSCLTLAGVATAPAAAASPPAQLTKFRCERSVDPLLRGLTVTAVMRPRPGTERLALRFDLLRATTPNGPYKVVHGPNLGRWFSPAGRAFSQNDENVWRVAHPVLGLPAPAYYRLRVSFRWVGTGGRTLAERVLRTPLCHQLELRPDLLVSSVDVAPVSGSASLDRYTAELANQGASGAGPFDVQLALADGTKSTQTVGWLGPHATTRVRFEAAACTAGQPVTVTADPDERVDDASRANNTLTIACPATLHLVKQ